VIIEGTYYPEYVGRYEGGEWHWYPDNGDGSGGIGGDPIAPPPPATLCPGVVAASAALQCSGSVAYRNNGCGRAGVGGWLVPEAPYEEVSFTGACNGHDTCYSNIGSSRQQCDANFGSAASQECSKPPSRAQFRSDGIERGLANSELANFVENAIYECEGYAMIYQGAVASQGAVPYQEGQQIAECRALKDLSNQNGCGL